MIPIKRAAIAVAVFLAFSGPLMAAEQHKKPTKAQTKRTVRAAPALPSVDSNTPLDPGQVAFQVLLGEIALQRGNVRLALDAYTDLARRTRNPKVLERATELVVYARRYDLANEMSALWLDVEPESVTARQTHVAGLILQGNTETLGPQITHILETDTDKLSDNLLRLNRMLSSFPDKAAAYSMLQKVLAPYDGVAESHFALATAALNAGEQKDSLLQIQKARSLRPDWDQAALFEAQLRAQNSGSEGLEVLESYLHANPKASELRLQLARALVAEKRYEDARKHFSKLLADKPDSPELTYAVAVLALQQNDVKTAEPMLQKVVGTGDGVAKSIAAYYLGQITEERGDVDAAIAYYDQVATGEQYVPAQIRVANLVAKQPEGLLRARAHLKQSAGRFPPAQVQFMLAEAQLLRDAGRESEALSLLEQSLAKQPNQPDVLYDAALLAEKLGRMDVLERNLRRVITLRPDSAHAYNALGYSYAERGIRLGEAQELVSKANELSPNDPFILDSMGWVLFKRGDLQGALDYLKRAYGLKTDAEIAAHLGEVYWKLDRQDEARQTWEEANKRHPDNEVLNTVRRKYLP